MLKHTTAALAVLVLKDLRIGPSTADSIAGRLRIDTETCEKICIKLLNDAHVETRTINGVLTVYHPTESGLQQIA
jgi:hypothetical protein